MASRLLTELATRIAATRDPVEAACLRAQRGTYLARQGKHDEAQAIVKAIREEFGTRPNAEVTAWISLVEALIHFYGQPGPQALDRLRRAHALSRAMNHPVLVPLCAAWLAHIEFNANHMGPMLQYAVEALRLAQPSHHAALARVSLVIADAFHYAGRFDLAKPWYAAVREHALADGDDAMISAMLHNVAALRTNHVRLADAFLEPQPDEAKRARLDLESTSNYDVGIGTLSFQSLIPLVKAQLFMSLGRFSDAIALYTHALANRTSENLQRREACFLAERAWCLLQLEQRDAARNDVEAACLRSTLPADLDDTAAMHARLALSLGILGEQGRSLQHQKRADDCRKELQDSHSAMAEGLQAALRDLRLPAA